MQQIKVFYLHYNGLDVIKQFIEDWHGEKIIYKDLYEMDLSHNRKGRNTGNEIGTGLH